MSVKAPRGVNDILPPDSFKWQYIRRKAEEIFELYNYEEIILPIFEHTELFQRGIGETTDIVEKEMYTFEDKGGRSITLRPEGTASVMRAYLEHKIYGQSQPTKYFYFGPMFRYERPQAGRFRQFYQIGVEVLGVDNPAVDVEVILVGFQILDTLGLKDCKLYINSVGCPECRSAYREALKDYFKPHLEKLCSDCQRRFERNPMRMLDCKNEDCKRHMEKAPVILDYLCEDCASDFDKVKSYLDLVQIPYEVDPGLVRGLDYYTKTAFEVKYSKLGAQDTLFAGGRYDGLGEEIGGKRVPGIGFAMGMERLILALKYQNVELPINRNIDLFITTIGSKAEKEAFKYLNQLRRAGLKAAMDYMGRSVKGQMKMADRLNARYSIILGDEELDKGSATIRNMETGEQDEVKLSNLVEEMKKRVK
ncbi:histidine--tRNA ligase [Anoxybacter fermentans]|uniref:Histidine--tRNA ligase n=1 Tax=Anoxybacter fermentans TaxID=1323375 RepID=A0A3Q9HQ39_9FIRM|nr:histidine--tRNA ligase [Anoxybacter fermentans]AZR73087.1 histidine--tRNA ligase [Anoxybacter fermentans]